MIVDGQLYPRTRAVIAVDELARRGMKTFDARILRASLVRTDGLGHFAVTLPRPHVSYLVHAFWQGDLRHGLAASWPISALPRFRPPAILKGSLAPKVATVQESVTMTCRREERSVSPERSPGTSRPPRRGPSSCSSSTTGDKVLQARVTPDGSWDVSYPLDAVGDLRVTASYFGDLGYAPASPASCDVNVAGSSPQATTLTLGCPEKASVKSTLAVGGVLTPAAQGAIVTITYTSPKGTVIDDVTTDATGTFTDSTTLTASGQWTSRASYAGDASHAASSSPVCTTAVS